MNAVSSIVAGDGPHGMIVHDQFEQGSQAWLDARCGLLTASEMKLIVKLEGGGTTTKYRATGTVPEKLTAKRQQALDAIGDRVGSMRDLSFLADVSDGVLRALVTAGAMEAVETAVPLSLKAWPDDREMLHLYELLSQRITRYVEPMYVSDDMLRGQLDEVHARNEYEEHHAPVTQCGFITNDEWGFTLGYSPDGLVGDDGAIEAKSRRAKYQVQTIVEHVGIAQCETIPTEYLMQHQTGMLVSKRRWIDFISYSGGLPMAVIRVHPDPVIQDAIINAAGEFERKLAEKRAIFDGAVAQYSLIPTERQIEQEMYA